MRKCQKHSVPRKVFTYHMEEITGTLLDKFQDINIEVALYYKSIQNRMKVPDL